jgi:hypothetical protein
MLAHVGDRNFRSDDFDFTKMNPWFNSVLVGSIPLSRKSWWEPQTLEYRITWKIYISYAGAVAERAEQYDQEYRICILRHSMFLEQFWAECEHHDKFQPIPLSPPQRSDSLTHWSVKLSPHLQYTGSLLKRSENRDSLLKRMCCQVWSLQQRRVRAQTTLAVTCHYLRISPTTGSLAWSPDSSSLLWTV